MVEKTFKIQKGPLICASVKMLSSSKCKICGEVPYAEKQKLNFVTGSTTIKAKIECLERAIRKVLRKVFTITIAFMATVELIIAILLFLNNVKHIKFFITVIALFYFFYLFIYFLIFFCCYFICLSFDLFMILSLHLYKLVLGEVTR